MTIKKKNFSEDEIALFDSVLLSKRGDFWHFRMWLAHERKYARFSLKTKNKQTAIDKAEEHYYELKVLEKQKKPYFSLTTKEGVAKYIEQREIDVKDGIIVKGRLSTIKTHLEHWLTYIGRDKRLKDLDKMDCYNYASHRTKTKKNIAISITTVLNEQSSINAMMSWLKKMNFTDIEAFEFKKQKVQDKGDDKLRRSIFTLDEMNDYWKSLNKYLADALKNIGDEDNYIKAITSFYIAISILTGLRRGEQLQLRWQDIRHETYNYNNEDHELISITVRAETSKVRRTRRFMIKDLDYFDRLFKLCKPKFDKQEAEKEKPKKWADALIFSTNGYTPITARAIDYHFKALLDKAEIKDVETRDLVPYSCRHYFITEKINSNLSLSAVAEMCGTSVLQIQSTYYHTTREKMVTNALAQYVLKDGLILPA